MRPITMVIAVILAAGLAFVPAVPITHLGDTSLVPVWWVYPSLLDFCRDTSASWRGIICCLVVIVMHLGFSLVLAAVAGMVLTGRED